jgi:hypothetical protein
VSDGDLLFTVDFFQECEKWARHIGRENIHCRVYDGSQPDIWEQFWSCFPACSRPQPALDAVDSGHANQSLGAKSLAVARLLNRAELEKRSQVYQTLFAALEPWDLPALLFDSEQAWAFRARFAESNAVFSECYLGKRMEDLGGRRYSDDQRDELFAAIQAALAL